MRIQQCIIVCILAILMTGCSVVGPSAIRNGRQTYNDSILATNNQQVLAMIVRMRYEEPSGLLAVSSVTANVRIQGNATAQFGIGSPGTYEGNLVPLAAGFVYEENPTISYTPVQGPQYLHQLLSPVPMDLTVLILQAAHHAPSLTLLLVQSINGVQTPRDGMGDREIDERLRRIATLMSSLDHRGSLTWVQDSGARQDYAIVLQGTGPEYEKDVSEFYVALGLRPPQNLTQRLVLPVRFGVGKQALDGIELSTRSVYELFQLAAASVDVPPEHVESGMAFPARAPESGHRGLRIARSSRRPDDAMVAVQLHGWWYSIPQTDSTSKTAFRLLETLLTARIAETVSARVAAPMLTVPVAR